MRLFFSVGEPSGDQHAAHLIHELRRRSPGMEFVGYGGPTMAAAGCEILFPLTEYAVMGIFRVIPLLLTFIKAGFAAKKYFQENKIDAVVLVDFPGFNWWIAYFARLNGIRVIYYMPPQLWAWAPWRIGRIKRNVDHVLSGLSFEKEWYEKRGVKAEFVGHPFFDEVAEHQLDQQFLKRISYPDTLMIGMLPGSRRMEVERNFPVMVEVMRRLVNQHPNIRFQVANYKQAQRDYCEKYLENQGGTSLPIEFHINRTPEIIAGADMILMVSGSVSLQVMARHKPAVIMYCGHWSMQVLGNLLITCRYMSLPNLMAQRELMPEFPFSIFHEKSVSSMTAILSEWIDKPFVRHQVARDIQNLCNDVAKPGAIDRAADKVMECLQQDRPRLYKAA